jgi:hypothetical protein
MDRASLIAHLERAERHVAQGEERLGRVRSLIERMAPETESRGIALNFLAQLEQAQRMHIAGRNRLRGVVWSIKGEGGLA